MQLRADQLARRESHLRYAIALEPAPAAIVLTDETVPMIVKYMMAPRPSEFQPALPPMLASGLTSARRKRARFRQILDR